MPERNPLPFDPIDEARRQWNAHGWDAAAPAMAVVTSIMRVQQILLGRADAALRPLDLTFARYEVLMLLSFSRHGALPLGKIGERLQVNPASVTNAIDRLEEQGLVARVPNPADGRGTLAQLTATGRARASAATDVMNAGVFSDVGIDEGGLEQLFSLLRGIRRAAGDFAASRVADAGDATGQRRRADQARAARTHAAPIVPT
jgi:DNA-binding MarR family transcriptional regulator